METQPDKLLTPEETAAYERGKEEGIRISNSGRQMYQRGFEDGKREGYQEEAVSCHEHVSKEVSAAVTAERERIRKWAEKNKYWFTDRKDVVVDCDDLLSALEEGNRLESEV